MRNNAFRFPQPLLLAFLALLIASGGLSAQLKLERDLIGAVAAPTVLSNGQVRQLQVDASFGESIIGYQAGDIIITVGFHQTETEPLEGDIGHVNPESEDEDVSKKLSVNTYPNPTVENVTVDLGEQYETFTELRIIDVNGRIMARRDVSGVRIVRFRQLDRLPNANYFLQGVGKNGKLHKLATIMTVTY